MSSRRHHRFCVAVGCPARLGFLLLGATFGGEGFGIMKLRAEEATNLPPALPPPEFMANKSSLPDLLLKDKRENRYTTGFPAIGWDPESGVNSASEVPV